MLKQELLIIINLRISSRIHPRAMISYLLFLIQVLKTISLYWSCILRENMKLSRKPSNMWWISHPLKQNFLPWGVILVKHLRYKGLSILLLLLMLFQLPKEYLSHPFIHINWTLSLYPVTLRSFLTRTQVIWFYFGTVLVIINGFCIYLLTKNQNSTKLVLFCLARYYETSAEKNNAIPLSRNGRCTFKCLTTREKISLI